MPKLTGIIRALEKRENQLAEEIKKVGAAIAALSGSSVRSMKKSSRRKISKALTSLEETKETTSVSIEPRGKSLRLHQLLTAFQTF